jgi:hypothetical protein
MKSIPLPVQLRLVAAGYALVLATAAVLVYGRHLLYVNHAAEAAAAGGMYAAGDVMLEFFIVCMLLVPTFFLVLAIRKSEALYTMYSKVLIGVSLTAPICAGLLSIPAVGQSPMLLGWICMDRLFASPLVIVGLALSRLLARFDRAKRLTLYALAIEVLTLIVIAALIVLWPSARRG